MDTSEFSEFVDGLLGAIAQIGLVITALFGAVLVFPFVMHWINEARYRSSGRPGGR